MGRHRWELDSGCQDWHRQRWEIEAGGAGSGKALDSTCPWGVTVHSGTGKMEHEVEGLEYCPNRGHTFDSKEHVYP